MFGKLTDLQEVENNAHKKVKECNTDMNAKVFFKNKSSFVLNLLCSGQESGKYITDPIETISQGNVGCVVHSKRSMASYGCSGYVSYVLDVYGKKYVVICGWSVPYGSGSKNSCSIEIRTPQGSTDQNGRLIGHWILPSGVPVNFGNMDSHDLKDSGSTKHYKALVSGFSVDCQYDNHSHATFSFVFQDSDGEIFNITE
jgi:hypothetical protein